MRRPIPSLAFVTLAAVAVALEAPATAGAGQLDPTFGDNGKVVTDLGGGDGITASLALGSKVVAVGESSGDVAVARYLGDGSLDDRFGGDGVALTDLGSDIDTAADVALAWSKAYLVIAHGIRTGGGGSQFNQFFLLRYTREGELDPRFGQDGVLTLDRRLFGRAMMVQPDEKVVIAGDVAGGTKFMVERLLRNGAPDPTFGGGDGKIVPVLVSISRVMPPTCCFNLTAEYWWWGGLTSTPLPAASSPWPGIDRVGVWIERSGPGGRPSGRLQSGLPSVLLWSQRAGSSSPRPRPGADPLDAASRTPLTCSSASIHTDGWTRDSVETVGRLSRPPSSRL
jgi:uncharacterized delta-60 repeat protein